jgi:outer membrane protein OmpA-like peptidoglycan-associated protein
VKHLLPVFCFVAAGIVFTNRSPAQTFACPVLPAFNQAIQAKNLEAAKQIESEITRDGACGPLSTAAVLQRVSLEVLLAADPSLRNEPLKRESLLIDADKPDVFWGAPEALGELRFSQRRFAEASAYFERAIELLKNPTKTPSDPPTPLKQKLLDQAAQARLLAANEEGDARAQYVEATRDFRDGKLGGSFSADIRGFKPVSVPLPINFETSSAKPNAIGLRAQADLLAAIREQRPMDILIIGHTDERGGDAYNLRLSEARARSVATYLSANGVTAKIIVQGHGSHDPLRTLENAAELTKSDIWALNRRVEWRRPGAK